MPRKLLLSFIVFAVFLILAEVTARLTESTLTPERAGERTAGWQAEFFGGMFDWHEPDPQLLWRFKANLDNPLIMTNTDGYLGQAVPVEKQSDAYRILLLGDSSPVGLGLESHGQTFGDMLKRLLAISLAGEAEVELVNAAVSGYTSEQVKRYLKLRGWRYDPDLVIVYCGNNDASISGSLSDRELFEAQRLGGLRRLLSRLAIYRVMRSLVLSGQDRESSEIASLKVRVDAEEYEENLRDIARQCREHNCPLVVVKPPVPYLWPAGLQFKVFTHVTGEDGRIILPDAMAVLLGRKIKYCFSRELFGELYGRGDVFTRGVYASAYSDSLAPDDAIALYSSRLAADSGSPLVLNNLGVSFWQAGDFAAAAEWLKRARRQYVETLPSDSPTAAIAAGSPFLYNLGMAHLAGSGDWSASLTDSSSTSFVLLDSALQADYFSLRIKRSYGARIDRLPGDTNLVVVDLPSVFAAHGGERLFVDHCHPTAEGHLLIARHLAETILARYF